MAHQFLLIMRQRDEGCDYTIGCGVATLVFEAESVKEAAAYALEQIAARGGFDGDRALSGAWLAASFCELPLEEWRTGYLEQLQREQALAVERRERAEYERLRAKYADDDSADG